MSPSLNLNYRDCHFLMGATQLSQLPADQAREVAFAGRSNAGKSSVLNTLTGHKKLARTSKTPGRTREINVFQLGESNRIVDLPGYGYAKVTKSMQEAWGKLLASYLNQRTGLVGLILIMDSRHPLKDSDQQLINWCNESQMPLHCLLTKADKMSRGQGLQELQRVKQELTKLNQFATAQLFSSTKKTGVDDLQHILNQWLAPTLEKELYATGHRQSQQP